MHDLNTINRLNAEAFADSIHNYRRQGRFVLAKYEGLHLVSLETFSDQASAQTALDTAVAAQHGGERNVLHTPVPATPVPVRDQSEDRKQPHSLERLAAFGRATTQPAEPVSRVDAVAAALGTTPEALIAPNAIYQAIPFMPAEQTLGDYITRKSTLLDNPQE